MRFIKVIPVLVMIFALTSSKVDGQCKSFARRECLPELGLYTHDGNYHAAVLFEGEEAELYKTFYSDMDYRMVICGDSKLPPIEFVVIDADRNILYTNKDNNYSKSWDFKLQTSQQLKLIIKVRVSDQSTGTAPTSGCVSIMVGFKIK